MCLFPNTVQILTSKVTGEMRSIFHEGDTFKADYEDDQWISQCFAVPCGECVECLEQYSNVWAFRCMLESYQHKNNCMLTLTYDNEHNPVSLDHRDFQLFIKRLRKAHSDLTIRYFGCGEYGGTTMRPHFHVLLFGYKPSDLCHYKKEGDHWLDLSNEISDLWGKGFISVCDLNVATAKYSAKYLQKLHAVPSYLRPAYTFMSRRPGIGYGCLSSANYQTDKLYVEGRTMSLPRYYLRDAEDSLKNYIKRMRQIKADLMHDTIADRKARSAVKMSQLGKVKK